MTAPAMRQVMAQSADRSGDSRPHAARRGRADPGARRCASEFECRHHHPDRPRRDRRPHHRPRNGGRRLSAEALSPARAAGAREERAAARLGAHHRDAPTGAARRRASPAGISISSTRELVSPAGEEVRLTTGEFDLLAAFVNNANQVLTPRPAARSRAQPRGRAVRPHDRRPGRPAAPQARGRPAKADHDQDGARHRLYLHPHRRGQLKGRSTWRRSGIWRSSRKTRPSSPTITPTSSA